MTGYSSILFVLFSFFLWAYRIEGTPRATADDVVYMTEDYPPYSFIVDGKMKGIAVDILGLMLQKMKAKKGVRDIAMVPWARGYSTALTKPNTCLFAMTGTKEREKLFKMVGPIEKFDSAALFAKKNRKYRIRSYADLKPYKIGILRDDIAQVNLTENGVNPKNLEVISSADSLAKMLAGDRIDMWAYGETSVPVIFKENGINPNEFENVFTLKTGDSYFAFSRQTSDELVAQFQHAYDELVKENKVRDVIEFYIKARL